MDGSASSAQFAYRIMAKRKHYEDRRLQAASVLIDRFMEPDLTPDELLQINERWGRGEEYRNVFYHQFSDTTTSEAQD